MNKSKPNAQHGEEPKGSYLHIRVNPAAKGYLGEAGTGARHEAECLGT